MACCPHVWGQVPSLPCASVSSPMKRGDWGTYLTGRLRGLDETEREEHVPEFLAHRTRFVNATVTVRVAVFTSVV